MPRGWRMWVAGMRPRTLTIAVAPLLPALALAARQTPPSPVVAGTALAAAVAIQAGTNLWNDYADGIRGGDRPGRVGPPRLTAMGWAPPDQVRLAALACFAVASALGLYLVGIGGWPIAALGAASLLAGWAYSCGRVPISHTPLGEAFVVAFFGMGAVGGLTWLLLGRLPPEAVVAGLMVGLPAAAVLHVNNSRDRDADARAGRRTLAILLGERGSLTAFAVMVLAPFALVALLPSAWPALLAAPLALRLLRAFAAGPGNPLLGATARFQLAFATLAALGMLPWPW